MKLKSKLCCVLNSKVNCPACGIHFCHDCWIADAIHSPTPRSRGELFCSSTGVKIEWVEVESLEDFRLIAKE
jgi:hypothetical protein